MSLSLLGAFLGGVLTLLSPCSVMLLPAFFAYAFSSPGALLARTGVFFLGLATALVPLGLLAGTLGAWVNQNRFTLVTVASALVILLGAAMLLGIRLPGVIQQRGAESASIASVFALGTVYGLAGVCAGPMLGAALAFAAFGGNALLGGLILLVFAAGMTVPLLLLALLWERLPAVRKLVRPRELVIGRWRNTWTNIVGGIITVGIGVLLLVTQGTTSLGGVLGATDQARLEAGVMQFANGVPDWAVAALFVALAGTWLTVFFARRGRARRAQALAELG
ncbi:cytochrome c biogenesis transmembrane protein [Leucobacter luti]|uniref:cytochrome c biogenesis CcdA family protein n=1 Tax=Leucobacter luti TaxID=340320 RepID=UPI001042C9F0|nr:cytochrome c biogenesis protein CcdA [Leucobacter luti]MCW2287355.1 cytochrome c biogenesis protein CcdA [Leucobacter luti]TCK41578.1 cytochrome c biogenesis transmembrane protein [Leucobacter luti]